MLKAIVVLRIVSEAAAPPSPPKLMIAAAVAAAQCCALLWSIRLLRISIVPLRLAMPPPLSPSRP